mmetsp:Transcript_35952/g.76750  ORF Transcript_35952/g.76750 Transcript_35952/m.76750 type:complete len:111 (+) Transcript_35952:1097-1429(+)
MRKWCENVVVKHDDGKNDYDCVDDKSDGEGVTKKKDEEDGWNILRAGSPSAPTNALALPSLPASVLDDLPHSPLPLHPKAVASPPPSLPLVHTGDTTIECDRRSIFRRRP